MRILFSIRHKRVIDQNLLKITFNERQRKKFYTFLIDYDVDWYESDDTGWNYKVYGLEEVIKNLIKGHGVDNLESLAGDESSKFDGLRDFIMAAKPEHVLDAIELLFDYEDAGSKKELFIKDLNKLLKIENIPMRFLEPDFVRLDSDFAESEILFFANKLLKDQNFDTSYDDFIDARQRLSMGDFAGSIIMANNALESFLKKLLNEKNFNQGELKKKLLKTQLIPDYFAGFLTSFEGLLQASFIIANKTSRHGRKDVPDEINKIDEPIATFCLNLVGTLIIFIAGRRIDYKAQQKSSEE